MRSIFALTRRGGVSNRTRLVFVYKRETEGPVLILPSISVCLEAHDTPIDRTEAPDPVTPRGFSREVLIERVG